MKNVKVFRVNEFDAVAALSEEQAKEWYSKVTGIPENEAFEGFEGEIPMNAEVWEDETMTAKITMTEIIKRYWKGTPFIAFSTEF